MFSDIKGLGRMSFSWKSTFYKMKGAAFRHYKLTLVLLVWSVLGICWSLINIHQQNNFVLLNVSVPDYLIKEQREYYFGIILFPEIMFWVMKCKQETVYSQFLLRYKGRTQAFRAQALESGIYAVGFSVFITITEIIAAYLICGKIGNWESESSFFYLNTSSTTSVSPFLIFVWIILMYCIKFMVAFAALDIFIWCGKWIVLFWIIIFVPYAVETTAKIFHRLFAVDYTHWINHSMPVLLAIGCMIILLEYILGSMIISKRDFYR